MTMPDAARSGPPSRPGPSPESGDPAALRSGLLRLAVWTAVLAVCFCRPLIELARYAWQSEIYSYILLVPFISGALLRWSRRQLPARLEPAPGWALVSLAAGLGVLGGYWLTVRTGWRPPVEEYLSLMTLSFGLLALSAAFGWLGMPILRQAAFPIGLLLCALPLPGAWLSWLEGFLQHGSADAAHVLFALAGMPLLRQDTVFQLPGFTLQVAPECSGIHSTLALFITSLVAGYVSLNSPWRRAVLSLAVIPLAVLRNGFRIFTIGQLCVHVSPNMIHSALHRRGGPLFFALSLVPFCLLLFLLRRGEVSRLSSCPK